MNESRDLLERARRLDRAAFGEIFNHYYDGLYRYIYHQLRNRPLAEDLAAEVFSRLVEAITDGGGPTQNLNGWLYRVAHNLVVDEIRKPHEEVGLHTNGYHVTQQSVTSEVHTSILYDQARDALKQLTPKQRAVIVLKFLEGHTNTEVAEMLDISRRAVMKLQQRGLAALRTHMMTMGASLELGA